MNENTRTPIESMAALLAEMTERAMEAERQRDAAKEDADQWYRGYLHKVAELEETKNEQASQRQEHEELRSSISENIDNM